MTGKIVILGAGGQVSRAWESLLGKQALVLPMERINFLDSSFTELLEAELGKKKIAAVVNAAAYTQVDNAEGEGRAEATRINAEAVGELAAWCKKHDYPLVHYSTDYVYGGGGVSPRQETAQPAPLNWYGYTKLMGDRAIEDQGGRYLIFRTSWIYDAKGNNFFNTMLRLFKEKDEVRVVEDQMGAPTYAPQLAMASHKVLGQALSMPEFPSGLYHLCGGGSTTWFGFAQAIFALARSYDSGIKCSRVVPIATADYPTPAKRPLNSLLDCSKAHATFGVSLPPWEEALCDCFEEKYGSKGLPHRRSQGG